VQMTCAQSLQQQQRHASKPWVLEHCVQQSVKQGLCWLLGCPAEDVGGSSSNSSSLG
jgi:hypothetical protein